jgi:PAS domain S-box-containing protein
MSNDIADPPAPSKTSRRVEPPALDADAVFATLAESDTDAVYFRDKMGICRMANVRCAQALGVPLDQMMGRPMAQFFPSAAVCALIKQEETVLADGVQRGCELNLGVQKDPRPHWVTHGVHCNARGEVVGVYGRMRDIAERKRLEKEIVEISEREMRRIARDLHDELCQELAAVSLIAKLLQKRLGDCDSAQSKVAAHIADLTRQMAVTTRDLVHNLAPEHLLGENFVASLRRVAVNLCAAFPVKCGIEGVWPEQLADATVAIQFYRIAHEAMHNAAKHSGGSCITVRLRASRESFKLSVGDNGHGFNIRNPASLGMGLSTMKYRAGLIGGELGIDSSPGAGTCVSCKVALRLQ